MPHAFSKYIQTHIFDAAFPPRTVGPPNANHAWSHRDDVTELYYRDAAHLKSVFSSEYVRTTVGPDGKNFNDFETSINVMATEKTISIATPLTIQMSDIAVETGSATVAMLFLASMEETTSGRQMEREVTPILVSALEAHAPNDAWGLIASTGLDSDFDLRKYFGGADMPVYALVYKVLLKSTASVSAFRIAQGDFYSKATGAFDQSHSFVVFGKEGTILDVSKGLRVSPSRSFHVHSC